MSSTSTEQRRARLVRRHHLRGDAADPVAAARSVVVLHATDPATVYLSVLARCADATVADLARVMYDERALVRMMAMRRTLFVVPVELASVVHHAASVGVAATMRKTLMKQLSTLPTDPELPRDADGLAAWLEGVERGVEAAVARLGVASGAQLGAAEPRLRTAILPSTDKKYDVRRTITSQVLALMGAEGRLVRREPLGTWTSRTHTWESAEAWWPGGLADVPAEEARAALVAAYLRAFGPVSETDVAWWTGWARGITRKALAAAGAVEVDGLILHPDDTDPVEVLEPTAALLPALDPTPMGWKERDWFLPEDREPHYDAFGNIGPTIWWGGEVIGCWSVRKDGSVVTRILEDRGAEAVAAVERERQRLHPRLEGAAVTPSFPTPGEKSLSNR